MTATRLALARLSRCGCVSSGSSSAAARGGVLEIPHVVRPAAVGSPSLHPATVGNLKSWQRFSTESRKRAGPQKAGSVLHMLGQWSKDCVRNVKTGKSLFVCAMIVNVTSLSFSLTNIWSLKQARDADARGEY
ncbi:unnamed protein product [Urochloa decumbens]|uniref:Uncharacterized protein n=1 Tax=Urochloa decumbens TaxID=240449 RepID=A0ABC8ZE60_9POAL